MTELKVLRPIIDKGIKVNTILLLLTLFSCNADTGNENTVKIKRLPNNPIISPAMSATIGDNINGPSLIRVPSWVEKPLGRYYLYFSHHKGKYIRLAYADQVSGPWTIYEPGALSLQDSGFPIKVDESRLTGTQRQRLQSIRDAGYGYTHIASPEVVVIPEKQEVRLYYHGMMETGEQATRAASSRDGLHFTSQPDVITRPYLRVFQWRGYFYGMAMPGIFYRSKDGLTDFEKGPDLFNPDMRHAGLMVRDETLFVFWTQVADAPERILLSSIDISSDWVDWKASEPIDVLRPEEKWEGAHLPVEASSRGAIEVPVNQLRDPEIFEEDNRTWLLYSVAGESGIAIAEIEQM
ncbi:MAG: hypothetical protein WD002_04090 [Pseudomonadales bacterium]